MANETRLWAVLAQYVLPAPSFQTAVRWAHQINAGLVAANDPDPDKIANVIPFTGTIEEHAAAIPDAYTAVMGLTNVTAPSVELRNPESVFWRGAVHVHGGTGKPGVDHEGYSIGLGGAALYFGEIPAERVDSTAAHLGDFTGVWVVFYPENKESPEVIGKAATAASAFRALEAIGRAIGHVPPVMRTDSAFPYVLDQASFDGLLKQLNDVLQFVNELANQLGCEDEHMDSRPGMPGFVEYIMNRVSPKA